MTAVSSGSHLLRSNSCVAEGARRDELLSMFLSLGSGVERPNRTMSFRLLESFFFFETAIRRKISAGVKLQKRNCARRKNHNSRLDTGQCGRHSKELRTWATQKHKTHDAGRSFVWCAANTSAGISSLPETRPSCVCGLKTGGGATARNAKFGPWSSTQWLQGRR